MNPLTKRLPRELKNNFSKYAAIFLMMVFAIGITSGFLSAASSIEKLIGTMDATYSIEDARFTTTFEATKSELSSAAKAAEGAGAGKTHIYKSYCFDLDFEAEGTQPNTIARVYQERTSVNLAAYAEGHAPQAKNEIAIDRVAANNMGVTLGSTVKVAGTEFSVCGIMTLPDYSALFEKNTDFMFNAVSFAVTTVSADAFKALEEEHSPTYTYSVRFENRDLTDAQRVDAETEMTDALSSAGVVLSDFADKDSNQGIGYPLDDVQSDSSMWTILMLMLIVIMAFMFVVLTSSTIEEESAIIGTLMASGWRKRELIAHYMAMPCIVGILAAIIGNLLGYIALVEPMKNLYYNSYSLPPYVASWDWEVFFVTTVAPVVLLVGITFIGLARKLRCTPLQFLRHETKKGGNKRGVALPERLPFPTRFRLRVFLQNLGNFVTLFFGIMFASLLLLFGLCIMPTMQHYADSMANDVPAQHLYTLKTPLEIDGSATEREAWAAAEKLTGARDVADLGLTPTELLSSLVKAQTINSEGHAYNTLENSAAAIAQAEKYAAASLQYERPSNAGLEAVSVYGVQENSRYWKDFSVDSGTVALSAGMMDKFGIKTGDSVQLTDKYEGKTYTFTVSKTYGSDSSIALYMPISQFNSTFGNDADYFNGYASNEALNLNERYVATDLTPESMDKIAAQMTNSMGDMMNMLLGLAVAIFLLFTFLLTKTVIDRSARAISYMKVFGYANREINRLYIRSISWTVAGSLVLSIPLIIAGLNAIMKAMLMEYSGNIVIYTPPERILETIVIGLVTYALVAVLHTRRIKKVSLALALKVQE